MPDKRLDKLAEIWQTNKKTPAIVEFVDIAGLVKGASQGAGLGNKFLGHIRECDAIVHVVRCFDDDNIIHVVEDVTKAEAVDPIADIDAIDYELILSDLEVVQNRAGRMAKAAKSGNNKGAAAEAAWLQQLAAHLESGKPARSFDFDENDAEQQTVLHEMGLLSAKPVLYACNVGEDDLMEGIENNKYVPLVAARAKEEGARYIPICAKTEEDIADTAPCGNLPEYWHPHRLGRWPPASGRTAPVPWSWAAPPPTSRTPGTACRMLPGTRHTGCGVARTSCRPHRTRNLSQNDYVSYPYSYG